MLHVIFALCQVLKFLYPLRVIDLPIKTESVCQMEAQMIGLCKYM